MVELYIAKAKITFEPLCCILNKKFKFSFSMKMLRSLFTALEGIPKVHFKE